MSYLDNPAACHMRHERTGLVSNQDPSAPWDKNEPLHMLSVCEREACIAKAITKVAGSTNRRATYYADADRGAARTEGHPVSAPRKLTPAAFEALLDAHPDAHLERDDVNQYLVVAGRVLASSPLGVPA